MLKHTMYPGKNLITHAFYIKNISAYPFLMHFLEMMNLYVKKIRWKELLM